MAYVKSGIRRAISRKELEEGTTIDIDDVFQSSSDEETYFDDEMSNNFSDELQKLTTGEYEKENEVDLSSLSIADLKEKMEPLTEDKLVLKMVLHEGVGPVLPNKSIVLMHYNASLEDQEEPFDSTYRRGNPHRFLLNAGYIIPGLDMAVSTMRKGEVAKIWIHASYGYGKMGCPPRIPGDANIVYNVEILNFIESKDAIEFEEMTPEDQRKAPFEKVLNVSRIEHQMGNDMCHNKKYPAAIARYQKARKLLEDVSVANEQEDKRRLERLLKLYLNLSFCFLKLKNARKAIFHSRKALGIEENNTKALYRLGQAYLLDNDFEPAKKYLLEAKHRAPYNTEISETLLKFEEKCKKFDDYDRNFCKKMFQFSSEDRQESTKRLPESPEFIQVITDCVVQFKNSTKTEYMFSSGYTPTQIDVIRSIVHSHDLLFIEKIYQQQKILKAMKRN